MPQENKAHQKAEYKTRQQSHIISFLSSVGDRHVTVSQITAWFKEQGIQVGKTTVYRQLERLQRQGLVQKFVTDGGGACFQYIGENPAPDEATHFHLKCLSCGRLLHMECDEIAHLKQHIYAAHDFEIQPRQTTFYGHCGECLRTKPVPHSRKNAAPNHNPAEKA